MAHGNPGPSSPGSPRTRFRALLLVGLLLSGCSLADLRPDSLRAPGALSGREEKAVRILEASLEARGGFQRFRDTAAWTLTGADTWNSRLIRWFTPVTERRQEFEAVFRSDPDEVRFRFLNGRRRGETVGLDAGGTYEEEAAGRRYDERSSLRLYLGPMRDYFRWPFTLRESPVLAHVGRKALNGRTYEVIFASGSPHPSEAADQYRIYIDPEVGRVEIIEFTLRALSPAYQGALHYRSFRRVDGLELAFFIGVSDSAEEDAFVHFFELTEIQRH